MRMGSKIAVIAGAVAVVLLGAALFYRFGPRRVPEGQPQLVALRSGDVEPLRAAFNASAGEVRILALLSPT